MARVGAAVDKLAVRATAASQPKPTGAAAMSSVVSYESLVHAVSGAVVSGRGGEGKLCGGSCQQMWWVWSELLQRCVWVTAGSRRCAGNHCWAARQEVEFEAFK